MSTSLVAQDRLLVPAAIALAPRLRVFSRRDAVWLLVPACLEPTRDALRTYGPLAYAGSFASDRLSPRELQLVLMQFDAASCARIPAETARRLLGQTRWARAMRSLRQLVLRPAGDDGFL